MRVNGWRGAVVAAFLALAGCGGGSGSGGQDNGGTRSDTVARASADAGITQPANPEAARVTVTWGVPPGVAPGSVVEYQVFRENDLIGVALPGLNSFVDWRGNPANVAFRVPDATGALTTGNTVATLYEVGSSYRYSVRAVYRGDDGQHRLLLLPESGFATPVARPGVLLPIPDKNFTRVQIPFQVVRGADQYVFEFSATSDFSKKVVRGPFTVLPTSGFPYLSEVFDLSADFASLPPGGRVFVRVGARNSLDAPGPISRDVNNGGNYVYSVENGSFSSISAPPAPPT